MDNRVLPICDEHGIEIKTVFTDSGLECCGRPDRHPYELCLHLKGVQHPTTKVRQPQDYGFIERFHRTLLDEHLGVKGRTPWHETLEEMQKGIED